MSEPTILTVDLNFLNRPGTIGVYLLPHSHGGLLIESGPASTIPQLIDGLKGYGFTPSDITDVFLTHIHLDHAGAAGWLAQQGARIHVHPNGANHLMNPEKLLDSAARVYGGQLDYLWGTFYPVRKTQVNVLQDNSLTTIGDIGIQALDVPGHANHHLAYLVDGACFTGDVGGIRVHNQKYISLPTPPPELHLEKWRSSIHRLIEIHPRQIIPTHFGIYPDAKWHLNTLLELIDTVDRWIEAIMPLSPSIETLREEFTRFEDDRSQQAGFHELFVESQQTVNSSVMSADGIFRYWNKHHPTSLT
jgi:glyoxylase-like metal-dependent hydrolase (beta-lactamase superfamily II)